MKGIIGICFVFFIGEYKAQISVYDCSVINPSVTEAEVNATYEFHKQCVLFEAQQNYQFSQADINKVTANDNIRIEEGFHAGSYSGNGHMKLKIEDKSLFDVFVMNYPDLNGVLKYEKFELDVGLPTGLNNKVASYLENIVSQEMINPYLDWEIRVYAEFSHPQLANSIIVDGFFYKEYDVISSYAPGTLPVPNNGVSYSDQEYTDLEQYVYSGLNYYFDNKFKIRFSPPILGLWTCKIHIATNNQTTVISSDPFAFNVVTSSNKGYLQVGSNKRYFKLATNLSILLVVMHLGLKLT